eukprot:1139894-Pelagomonas_calceolata.AAC.1
MNLQTHHISCRDCGPDPEPAYASISTTPVTMSRATTPAQSRPTSAGPGSYTQPSPHQSRPSSGVPAPPSPPPRPHTPPQTELSQQHVSLGACMCQCARARACVRVCASSCVLAQV